jgi:phosphoribosyl 1,2-cyclic phosphodiesterase
MRVKFWGTRGSVPTPGRATEKFGGNTTCVEIVAQDHRLILDAGTGIRELGLVLAEEGPSASSMCFSHLHWDHIQGLPFFSPLFLKGFEITIFAPAQLKSPLKKVLNKQMATDVFPVDFADLSADIRFETLAKRGITTGPFRITALPQQHPGGSWAYRVEADGRTVYYSTDNETDPDADADAHARQIAAFRDANLLIVDGQYTLHEYPSRRGWGHGVLEHVTKLALEAGVDRVAFTHHDPMRDDDELTGLERRIRKSSPDLQLFFARDGLAVKV